MPRSRLTWAVLLLACLWAIPGCALAGPTKPGPLAPEAVEPSGGGIPYRAEEAFSAGAIARLALALLVAIALAVVVLYLLKRFFFRTGVPGAPGQRIQLLEVRRLSPKLVLFLVAVDGEAYLLAQSGDNLISLRHGLSARTPNDEVAR